MPVGFAHSELGFAVVLKALTRTTPDGAQAGANDIVDMPGTKTEDQALRGAGQLALLALSLPGSAPAARWGFS